MSVLVTPHLSEAWRSYREHAQECHQTAFVDVRQRVTAYTQQAIGQPPKNSGISAPTTGIWESIPRLPNITSGLPDFMYGT
jgi:hypothetical protein